MFRTSRSVLLSVLHTWQQQTPRSCSANGGNWEPKGDKKTGLYLSLDLRVTSCLRRGWYLVVDGRLNSNAANDVEEVSMSGRRNPGFYFYRVPSNKIT